VQTKLKKPASPTPLQLPPRCFLPFPSGWGPRVVGATRGQSEDAVDTADRWPEEVVETAELSVRKVVPTLTSNKR
jgi:hypothetical protein